MNIWKKSILIYVFVFDVLGTGTQLGLLTVNVLLKGGRSSVKEHVFYPITTKELGFRRAMVELI